MNDLQFFLTQKSINNIKEELKTKNIRQILNDIALDNLSKINNTTN